MLVLLKQINPIKPFLELVERWFDRIAFDRLRQRLGWQVTIGICLLLLSNLVSADFSIRYAKTRLDNSVYLLDANFDYTLTEVAADALQNGISLTLVLTITIKRERWYWWDATIATLIQRYQLKYHVLTRQYVVKYLNTGIQETFPTLNTALTRLSKLTDFPLLDKQLVDKSGHYWVQLQTYLDIEALPAPLRPVAYFSSQWRLASEWYVCPLTSAR